MKDVDFDLKVLLTMINDNGNERNCQSVPQIF